MSNNIVVGNQKFKSFPVRFGKVIIPLGEIKSIMELKHDGEKCVCVYTFSGDSFKIFNLSLEEAEKIYLSAYSTSEI